MANPLAGELEAIPEISTSQKIGQALMAYAAGSRGQGQQYHERLNEDRQKALVQDADTVKNLLESGETARARSLLINRVKSINSLGGDASDTVGVINDLDNGNLEGALNKVNYVVNLGRSKGLLADPRQVEYDRRMADAKLAQEERLAFGEEPTKFEQGKGSMEGFAFNPATGEYSLSEEGRNELMKLGEKEYLSPKDIAGINDKVTALTKQPIAMKEAYDSMVALRGKNTPASQMAAVFKFMKILDPTSTVRESEQGQVYSAEGPAMALAAQLNRLVGKGGLTESNFNDIVATARDMAQAGLSNGQETVDNYLDVIRDNIPPRQYEKLRSRIPSIGSSGDASTSGRKEVPTVTNASEYADIPSGAEFRDSSGKIYRKP